MKTKTKKIEENMKTRDSSLMEEKKQSVAKQVQLILEENGFALYPYIERLQHASIARVTIVEVPKTEPVKEDAKN